MQEIRNYLYNIIKKLQFAYYRLVVSYLMSNRIKLILILQSKFQNYSVNF